MARYEPLSIDVDGRRCSGAWQVEDGHVVVSSAYGSKAAKAGRAKPENIAAQLLRQIVEERRTKH